MEASAPGDEKPESADGALHFPFGERIVIVVEGALGELLCAFANPGKVACHSAEWLASP